jgi:hypothetical protein
MQQLSVLRQKILQQFTPFSLLCFPSLITYVSCNGYTVHSSDGTLMLTAALARLRFSIQPARPLILAREIKLI